TATVAAPWSRTRAATRTTAWNTTGRTTTTRTPPGGRPGGWSSTAFRGKTVTSPFPARTTGWIEATQIVAGRHVSWPLRVRGAGGPYARNMEKEHACEAEEVQSTEQVHRPSPRAGVGNHHVRVDIPAGEDPVDYVREHLDRLITDAMSAADNGEQGVHAA